MRLGDAAYVFVATWERQLCTLVKGLVQSFQVSLLS